MSLVVFENYCWPKILEVIREAVTTGLTIRYGSVIMFIIC